MRTMKPSIYLVVIEDHYFVTYLPLHGMWLITCNDSSRTKRSSKGFLEEVLNSFWLYFQRGTLGLELEHLNIICELKWKDQKKKIIPISETIMIVEMNNLVQASGIDICFSWLYISQWGRLMQIPIIVLWKWRLREIRIS